MSNPLYISVLFFVTLTGGLFLMLQRLYIRPSQIRTRLGQPVVSRRLDEAPAMPAAQRLLELIQQLGKRISSGRSDAVTQQMLTMAGYRHEQALQIFMGLRSAALVGLLVCAVLAPIGDQTNMLMRMMLVVAGMGVGWRLPLFLLKKKVAERQERLRLALPDALDLIIISVEAGLGLDQAIQHVAQEIHGADNKDLCEELQLIGMEMRAGRRRADALKAFADRTGEDEIQKLTALMIQNDKFGTSMGEAMRNHSQFMRVQRKQRADEKASKVGVKLVFPIFFFILPSMMIVSAGPGMLQIFKQLFPMMKQFH